MPQSREELLRVPGIGPYTAGAIASIAFNQPAAVVDGNVVRVFARLAALKGHSKCPALHKRCWKLAEDLVDPERPAEFNQALMELGATVCTPLAPACSRCPLSATCKALKLVTAGQVGSVTDFPAKQSQKPRRQRILALAAVADASDCWMLVRRPKTGLLAGQLDFPSVDVADLEGTDDRKAASVLRLQKLLVELGFRQEVTLTPLSAQVEHVFSHEHHIMHVFRGCIAGHGEPSELKPNVSWLTLQQAQEAGITSGLQKARLAKEALLSHLDLGLVVLSLSSCLLQVQVLHALLPTFPAKRAAKRQKH